MGGGFGCIRRRREDSGHTSQISKIHDEPASFDSVHVSEGTEQTQHDTIIRVERHLTRTLSRISRYVSPRKTPQREAIDKLNAMCSNLTASGCDNADLIKELNCITNLVRKVLLVDKVAKPDEYNWDALVVTNNLDSEERRSLLFRLRGQGENEGVLPLPLKINSAPDLCTAAASGDVVLLKHLAAGEDVNAGDYDCRTALHLAASEGSLAVVQCLVLELQANLSPIDRWGGTPLDDAIRSGYEDVSSFLQEKGAVTGKSSKGIEDPAADFCNAASRGDVNTLRTLVHQFGLSPDLSDYDKRTAIHLAASEGLLEAVQCLVEELHADLNPVDRWGGTPLDDAQRSGHQAVIAFLQSKDAVAGVRVKAAEDPSGDFCSAASRGDVSTLRKFVIDHGLSPDLGDYDKRTAIHLAASEGHLEAVKCLVEELHAGMNPVDRWGGTPLDDAQRSGHQAVTAFLQLKGAVAGVRVKAAEDPSADFCSAASRGDVSTLRKFVFDSGLNPDLADYDKRTAMHLAASEGHFEAVLCLVEELHANMNPVDRWGGTPLDDAQRSGHQAVIAFLRSKGAMAGVGVKASADPSADFCSAASRGDVNILRMLVRDNGLSPDLGDYDKRTAIHLAASEGRLEAVLCLVEELHANLNPVDRWGGTPLDDAQRSGHEAVVSYLQAKGAVAGSGNGVKIHASSKITPGALCEASASGDLLQLQELVSKPGVDVNVGDYDQRTAIHLASSEGLLDIVMYLVNDLNADVNPTDRWGGTPLDDAMRNNHHDIVQFLMHNGGKPGISRRASLGSSKNLRINISQEKVMELDRRALHFNASVHHMVEDALVSWDANTLKLQEASEGNALLLLGQSVLGHHNMLRSCNIEPRMFQRFLLQIQTDYGSNPFHNSSHAADVLLSTHVFLSKYPFVHGLKKCELLAVLLAAIIHDYKHPGTTNSHEIKVQSELACMYSDDAVLERHHLASAFMVLNCNSIAILKQLDQDSYRRLRQVIIYVVLHTDLGRHFDYIGRLEVLSSAGGYRAFVENATGDKREWISPFLDESADVMTLLSTAVKFADLGHCTKPFLVHEAWTRRVTQEFWELGDKEVEMGVVVSPFCDRQRDNNIPKGQVGFLNFMCSPFYKLVEDLVEPHMIPYLQLKNNLRHWLEKVEKSEKCLSSRSFQSSA